MSDDIKALIDIPRVHGRTQGQKVAVAFEGRDLTYAELDRRSDKVAAALQGMGVKPGDRVAWLGRPSEAWYEIFFGVAKAPGDPGDRLHPEGLLGQRVLRDAGVLRMRGHGGGACRPTDPGGRRGRRAS